MVNSINTNSGAMNALQRLSSTRNDLDKTQSHISTGKKINSPKDDAATLAIAQQLMSTFAGTDAVREGLSRASATVDVAVAAGESTSDMLIEMKSLAVQANQEGLDQTSRDALNASFNSLRDQIVSINDSADFAGTNLIANGLAQLGIGPPGGEEGNLIVTPERGLLDEDGVLIEDRARVVLTGLAKVLEVLSQMVED